MNKETNSDIFKVCIDTGHSNFCGEAPADAVRLVGGEYLGALHVHDNNGKADQHLRPGFGNVDWDAFSDALVEIGFEGSVNFETAVPSSVPNGEDRDAQEIELANWGLRIAKKL
jgi:sugar phosphate isomerase/epimerase